jgi:hypothetical protein
LRLGSILPKRSLKPVDCSTTSSCSRMHHRMPLRGSESRAGPSLSSHPPARKTGALQAS